MGRFHILTIVNNALMNTRVHIFFRFSVWDSLDILAEVELVGHKAVLFLIF